MALDRLLGAAVGALLLLTARSSGDPNTGHGYETKAFTQAYLECLQYLNISQQPMLAFDAQQGPDAPGNCLMRCIGLTLRWWDDRVGVSERALLQFFRHRSDETALRLASTCIAELGDPSSEEPCTAAYSSFRCYSDALGELAASPEYVIPSRQEARQIVRHCALVLQVPPERIAEYAGTGSFLLDDPATCLLRCVATRLGLYTDATGVLCDRLQLLATDANGSLTDVEEQLARQCEANVRDSHVDVCHVAAHSIETCYGRRAFGELWTAIAEEFDHPETPMLDVETGRNETCHAKENESLAQHSSSCSSEPEVAFFYPARKGIYQPVVLVEPLQPGVYVVPESTTGEQDGNSTTDLPVPDDNSNALVPGAAEFRETIPSN